MAVTQYIGSRYVPLFADPIEWSSSNTYEPLTIVLHEGNSYTSKQAVPKDIDISNESFWALTGNYDAQVELYRRETATAQAAAEAAQADVDELERKTIAVTASTPEYYGAVGDGIADDSAAVQQALDNNEYVVFQKIYNCPTDLTLKSGNKLTGSGTIIGNVNVIGATFTTALVSDFASPSKIDFISNVPAYNILLVEKRTSDVSQNKRQIDFTTQTDGSLLTQLINYGSEYTVAYTEGIQNVSIDGITINGLVTIARAHNVYINNCVINSRVNIFHSICVYLDNTSFNFGAEQRVDVYRGSSNVYVNNCIFMGGNTESDNSSLKFNETFYCGVRDCVFGKPLISGGGTFHAVMFDGVYTEDGFSNNPGYHNYVDGACIADGYTRGVLVTVQHDFKCSNIVNSNVHVKVSDNVQVNDSKLTYLLLETGNTNITVSGCRIASLRSGERRNTTFNDCYFEDIELTTNNNDNTFVACVFENLSFRQIQRDNIKNIRFIKCTLKNSTTIGGITNGVLDITCEAPILLNSLSFVTGSIFVVDGAGTYAVDIITDIDKCKLDLFVNGGTYDHSWHVRSASKIDTSTVFVKSYLDVSGADFSLNVTKGTNPANTSDTFNRGDIVLNREVSSGNVFGWVCVQGGTPGIWRVISTIPTS